MIDMIDDEYTKDNKQALYTKDNKQALEQLATLLECTLLQILAKVDLRQLDLTHAELTHAEIERVAVQIKIKNGNFLPIIVVTCS